MKQANIGFLSLLALIFIGLKLAGIGIVAQWSWWAVLSPLWGPVVLVLSIMVVYFVALMVTEAVKRL